MFYDYKTKADDNQTFLITSPDFPEVTSFAESKDEIEAVARAAIEEAICARMADKEPIPEPHSSSKSGVSISLIIALKIGLYNALHGKKQKRYNFGKQLGLKPAQIDRLFDIRYPSKVDTLEEALLALDIKPSVTFKKRA